MVLLGVRKPVAISAPAAFKVIRILNAVFVTKHTSSHVTAAEFDELGNLAGFAEIDAEAGDPNGPGQHQLCRRGTRPGSAAAVLPVEDLWAAPPGARGRPTPGLQRPGVRRLGHFPAGSRAVPAPGSSAAQLSGSEQAIVTKVKPGLAIINTTPRYDSEAAAGTGMVIRQMSGRANLDLLRKRILLST